MCPFKIVIFGKKQFSGHLIDVQNYYYSRPPPPAPDHRRHSKEFLHHHEELSSDKFHPRFATSTAAASGPGTRPPQPPTVDPVLPSSGFQSLEEEVVFLRSLRSAADDGTASRASIKSDAAREHHGGQEAQGRVSKEEGFYIVPIVSTAVICFVVLQD